MTSRGERGAAAIEVVLTAVAATMLIVFVVATGRYGDAEGQASDAAYAAARAASLSSTAEAGFAQGRQAAVTSLEDRGKACQNISVSFVGSDFTPGGQVVAEVECTASLVDAGALGRALGLEPRRVFRERAVVPIETHRGSP